MARIGIQFRLSGRCYLWMTEGVEPALRLTRRNEALLRHQLNPVFAGFCADCKLPGKTGRNPELLLHVIVPFILPRASANPEARREPAAVEDAHELMCSAG